MLAKLIFANRSDVKIELARLCWKKDFPQAVFIRTILTPEEKINVSLSAPTIVIGSYESDRHWSRVVGDTKSGFEIFVTTIDSRHQLLFEKAYILPENSHVSYRKETYNGDFVPAVNEVALLNRDGDTQTARVWTAKANCPRVGAISKRAKTIEMDFEVFFWKLFFKEFDYSCESNERVIELLELVTGLKKPVYGDVEPKADEVLLSGVLRSAFSEDEIAVFLGNKVKTIVPKPGGHVSRFRITDVFTCLFVRPMGNFVSIEVCLNLYWGTYTRAFSIDLHKNEVENKLRIARKLVEQNSEKFLKFLDRYDESLSEQDRNSMAMKLLQKSLDGDLK